MANVTTGGPTDTGIGSFTGSGTGYGSTGMSGGGTTGIEQKLDSIKQRPFEGNVTRRIELQTAKIPSTAYLLAAGLSIAGSLALYIAKRPITAIYVGLWAPSFLLLGNYNKLVKVQSESRRERSQAF